MTGQCGLKVVVVEPLSVDARVSFGRAMVVLRDEDCSVSVNLSREQIGALDMILNKILTVMDGEEYKITDRFLYSPIGMDTVSGV